ncbi:MAG TPA: hypothetical protein VNC84_07910 [Gammaproteobacteria bacterium]|jgi:hypothetical protein|nr:hypothetical protein [Gammaproteobacteria bacterium]
MFGRLFKMAAPQVQVRPPAQPISIASDAKTSAETPTQHESLRPKNINKDAVIEITRMLSEQLRELVFPAKRLAELVSKTAACQTVLVQLELAAPVVLEPTEQAKIEDEVRRRVEQILLSVREASTVEQAEKIRTTIAIGEELKGHLEAGLKARKEIEKLEKRQKIHSLIAKAREEAGRIMLGIEELRVFIANGVKVVRACLANAKRAVISSHKYPLNEIAFREVVDVLQLYMARLNTGVAFCQSLEVPIECRNEHAVQLLASFSAKMQSYATELLQEIDQAKTEVDQVSFDPGCSRRMR